MTGRFLGYDIVSMAPPSSGGVALIEMLNILQAENIQKQQRDSPAALHLEIEAMRRAFLGPGAVPGRPGFRRRAGGAADPRASYAQ